MLSIRIDVARAALAAAILMAGAVGAAAQSAPPAAAPGKPIQLLKIVERSDKATKTKSHVKPLAKVHHKHIAAKASNAPVPANGPAITTVSAIPAINPPVDSALAFAEPMPGVVNVAGQSVQVAVPDDVNDIDRAADTLDKLARKNVAGPDAALVSESLPSGSSAQVATSTPEPNNPTSGSASWLAEALAALGGAIAAASAAWFLIGSTPQRLYG